jgi:hypothetical protein
VNVCACGCGREVEPSSGPRPRLYASVACRNKRACASYDARHNRASRRLRDRLDVRGRVCRWCEAADHVCGACERQTQRPGGRCGSCRGPRARWGCPRCHRPAGLVTVVVLDAGSDRERTVYRTPKDGAVSVGGRLLRPHEDLVVVSFPTEKWVEVRL